MRRALGVLVLAGVLAVAGGSLASGAAASSPGNLRRARGMAAYEWDNPGDLSPEVVWDRLSFLRANGFRTVYVELGRYLDAGDLPPGRERERRLAERRGEIRRFVATASSLGLAVHAVGGAPDWTGERRYLGQLLVRLVGEYNTRVRAHERLRGVQLDIEPYVLWGPQDNLQAKFAEYLKALGGIVRAYRPLLARSANRGLQLGFAIPFWFDAMEGAPGPVRFKGVTKPAAHHIIDLVRNLPCAYLVVMSYRNRTDGANGSIALARNEFRYARAVRAASGLVVGQQYGPPEQQEPPTDDTPPPPNTTTFHGQPRSAFWTAAAEITAAFSRYPQFRGLALDGIDEYRAATP